MWPEPSPAMTKAFLVATTTYLTGDGANDTLPSNSQGYGRVNLDMAFDGSPNQRVDQTHTFGDTGAVYTLSGTIADASKPFRVVLAWTDEPGPTMGDAYVNDLDLEIFVPNVEGDYLLFHGNHFSGASSVCLELIGVPPPRPECVWDPIVDPRNNVEAVFLPGGALPPGTAYQVRVRATRIEGNGVPNTNGDPTDQDFALFIYNGTP